MVDLVEVLGFRSRAFDSAEAMLGSTDPFNLVITDVHMAGLSGLDLVERLAASAPGLPVIVVTARDEAMSAERARRAGARAFLVKPISQAILSQHIARALDGGTS